MFAAPPNAPAGEAAQQQAQQQAQQLSHELMSPYCPGRTISTCPSPAARRLEDEIAADFARGSSREQVIEHLEQRFGEKLGARFDPLPYAAVFLTALAGAFTIVILARRWRSSASRRAPSMPIGASSSPAAPETIPSSVREAGEPADLNAAPANAEELARLEAALARADGL